MDTIQLYKVVAYDANDKLILPEDIMHFTKEGAESTAKEMGFKDYFVVPVAARDKAYRDAALERAIRTLFNEAEHNGQSTCPLSDSIRLTLYNWDDILRENRINVEMKHENEEWKLVDYIALWEEFYDYSDMLFGCDSLMETLCYLIEEILGDLEEEEEE